MAFVNTNKDKVEMSFHISSEGISSDSDHGTNLIKLLDSFTKIANIKGIRNPMELKPFFHETLETIKRELYGLGIEDARADIDKTVLLAWMETVYYEEITRLSDRLHLTEKEILEKLAEAEEIAFRPGRNEQGEYLYYIEKIYLEPFIDASANEEGRPGLSLSFSRKGQFLISLGKADRNIPETEQRVRMLRAYITGVRLICKAFSVDYLEKIGISTMRDLIWNRDGTDFWGSSIMEYYNSQKDGWKKVIKIADGSEEKDEQT